MQIVTGYTGTPHITAQQDRDLNAGIVGNGNYILNVGAKLAASIVSNNEIAVSDGALIMQGCLGVIEAGDIQTLTISNGTAGMQRKDLIVAEYTKSGSGVESLDLKVIEGTPAASDPADPVYVEQSIRNGATLSQVPLYRVNISGISITGLDALLTEAPTIQGQNSVIEQHTSQISTINKALASLLSVQNKSGGAKTIAANARTTVSISVARSGYTALGIVGWDAGAHEFQCYDVKLTNASAAEMRLWNVTNSSVTGTPQIRVLYLKNS